MSGGRLVVLDRLGRDDRSYDLPSGMVTLGSDPRTDIKIMMPNVSLQHAKVVVHANQTIVRNVGSYATLVNGREVSVAALQHGDVITVGGRSLRWEYLQPGRRRPMHAEPALVAGGRGSGRKARCSGGGASPARSPALQLALELRHRASMPVSASAKQVAIVTPQRRDTNHLNPHEGTRETNPRKSVRVTPKSNLAHTTKATLWLEARKASPRNIVRSTTPPPLPRRVAASAKKSTPLRLAVLRRVQSAQKPSVAKIQEPSNIDYTKQAAIRLMTRHTPKSAVPSPQATAGKKTPSYVPKKPSPLRKSRSGSGRKSARMSKEDATPRKDSTFESRRSKRTTWGQSVSVLEITDSDQNSTIKSSRTTRGSSLLPSPRKSALKDPKADKSHRKTESIKFDLSNLENFQDDDEIIEHASKDNTSEDELSLHYSDTNIQSPSPRRSIHSRSSKILQKTLGTTINETIASEPSTLTPQSTSRKSLRGSIIMRKALGVPDEKKSRYSSRTTKSASESFSSARKTLTLSPDSHSNSTVESYSVVDLVSIDSNESCRSTVYNSAGSVNSSTSNFGTPNERKTRSTIDPKSLVSSTPYVGKTRKSGSRNSSLRSSVKVISPRDSLIKVISPRNSSIKSTSKNFSPKNSPQNSTLQNSVTMSLSNSTVGDSSIQNTTRNLSSRNTSKRSQSSPNISGNSHTSTRNSTRRSKSLTTPENTSKHISVNSARIARRSRSRSRLNDSELLLLDVTDVDDSPKSSKRASRATKSQGSPAQNTRVSRRNLTVNTSIESPQQNNGTITPENVHSPEEAGTPMFSIQSLLDSSQGSVSSNRSVKKGRISFNTDRKTIDVVRDAKKSRNSLRSRSFNPMTGSRKSNSLNRSQSDTEIVTPKSAVKLVQEAVKNKHSSAKKPQSKRSIIDNLNDSDIVKQLFNSPVKRKLSQSMTEFSKKQLFDDDDVPATRPARNTIAVIERSEDSLLEHTERYTPDIFVSPIHTPDKSPNLSGVKLMFRRNKTPSNDLRNVQGVKDLFRSPRTRKSIKNDLTTVGGIKKVFTKYPQNRLSDFGGVKEMFAAKENNDLRRVTGVKSLFHVKGKSPKNDLSDVRGVRSLFQKNSPQNDLRNVSGVKKGLRINSPKNDLTDVRGVRRMFKQKRQASNDLDVSGIEELFNESNGSYKEASNAESMFDQLVGRAVAKSVYSKSVLRTQSKAKGGRNAKSLASVDVNTYSVENWLEQELQKRMQNVKNKSIDKSNKSLSKELLKLATDTVEGNEPMPSSRVRNSTIMKTTINERQKSASEVYSAHTLPIKKRSLVEPEKANTSKNLLPIKKRTVMHSTPVKGRYNMTMNASELGRVSPIVPVDKTRQQDDELPPPPEPKASARGRRTKKANQVEEVITAPRPKETLKSSPVNSPIKRRATRAKANNIVPVVTNTKKRRASLVITKKSPVMSRKSVPKRGREVAETKENTIDASPKPATKTKRTQKKENSDENANVNSPAPKTTRRGRKVTENLSPKPAPKSTRRGKKVDDTPKPSPKKIRGRRVAETKPTTPKISRAKVQKGAVVVSKPSPVVKPQPSRGRKVKDILDVERARRTEKVKTSPIISPSKRRRAPNNASNAQAARVEEPQVKRGRKTAPVEKEPSKRTRKTQETVAQKGRKTTNSPKKFEPKARGKKVKSQMSVESEPVRGRGKKNNVVNNTAPVETGRKRKPVKKDTPKLEKSKSEEQPTRGKRVTKEEASAKEDKEERRGRSKAAGSTKQPAKLTKATQKVDEPKPARGRKATAMPAVEAPKAGGRKRKTETEVSDVKKQPAAKKARSTIAASPAKRSTRARNNTSIIDATTRSRRR